MKIFSKLFLVWLLTFNLFATHDSIKFMENDEVGTATIKILILENIDGALIDVGGKFKVYDHKDKKVLSSGFSGKRYYLQANAQGLKWGECYPGIHQIKIEPSSKDTSILVNGIQYQGALEIYNVNSKIQIVNELPIDDFLKSILSSEESLKGLHEYALDAVVIAVRTNFYYTVFKNQNPFWNVHCNEVEYRGHGTVLINPDVDRAVTSTKNLILTLNEKPFPTTWTKNCAGNTACYETIYRKKSISPEGVCVSYAQRERGRHKWKCSVSTAELAKLANLDKIIAVDLFQDPKSRKVYGLRISDNKRFVEMSFFEFQNLLGKNRILSNDFSVNLINNNVAFDGCGEGYGVGICLFSANKMAQVGDNVGQILNNFYPSTYLVKVSTIPIEEKLPQLEE